MIARYLLVALVAGLIAGGLVTVAQYAKVVPLILEAEKYEGGAPEGHDHSAALDLSFVSEAWAQQANDAAPAAEADATEEEGGMLFVVSRLTGTIMANLVTGCGLALLLVAASLLTGVPINLANGVLWGSAAWVAVQLMPAIGLPPELPGFPAADLADRQIWWTATVVLSAGGLYLLILRKEVWAKVTGLVALVVPHVVGAPQPVDLSSNVPAVLAAEFAVAALATGLFFLIVTSLLIGTFAERLVKSA